MKYDIIIIGGGPAGITAAIYALRANKKVLLFEKEVIGGKIASATLVENYPGIEKIKGAELSDHLYQQVIKLGGQILAKEVIEIDIKEGKKQVKTKEESYLCDALIIATGTKYKKLGIEKEEELIGRGISFCATCDAFLYKNKVVSVVGGGNSAVANALELANVCKKVYLIQILDHLTAEQILVNQLQEKENVEILYHTSVKKILGDSKIIGIEIEKQGKTTILTINGMFLSIGQIPETDLVKKWIQTDNRDYIITNKNFMTDQQGIFAAGDCVEKEVRQLTTAVNDGTIAALNAIKYIENNRQMKE